MQQYFPISELSTFHSKWVIRARVTAKGNLRSFSSRAGGEVQVFDSTLLDESGSEIRASFFAQAAEKYYGKIEVGKVFTFTGGNTKIANRQYNRCNHRYELVFDKFAEIAEVADDTKIKTVSFDITGLRAVQSRVLPCTVDLCGVIVSFRPPLAFTSKDGKELVKREVTLADDSETSMAVTLWGERAKKEDKVFEGNPVVCMKGVMVKEWQGGRGGSLMESGIMEIQADIPETKRVLQWWSKEGAASNFTSLSLAHDGLTDLEALQTKAIPCTVELCGVVIAFKSIFTFATKDGRELVKREITIADDTGKSMVVALWGPKAQQEDSVFENNPVLKLSGVRVQEWQGGRSGSLLAAGSMARNPMTPEAKRIQSWWSQGGSSQSITALSVEGGGGGGMRAPTGTASNLAEVREASEQVTAQGETYSLVTRLALVQMRKRDEVQPLYYIACQEPKQGNGLPCNKRVDSGGFCAVCNRVGKAAPRLNIRCRFSDYSDSVWLTTFHEAAQKVLATEAEALQALESGEDGRDSVEALIRKKYFQQPMQLSIRAKLDTYMGETRPNISCVDARPVQRGVHARAMLKGIKQMLA